MSIQFTGQRYLSTAALTHLFCNEPVGSMWFKIRADDRHSGAGTAVNVISRLAFSHKFFGVTGAASNMISTLNGTAAATATIPMTLGTVYVVCYIWNGTVPEQVLYVNGVVSIFGRVAGNTYGAPDAITLGPSLASPTLTYTIGDFNCRDGYHMTLADVQYLTNNGDPTTIGTGASWSLRWTLDGVTGQAAAIGDLALKNTFGSGGDFTSIAGPGTAIYKDPLIWAPTVTAHPYVTGCGKLIGSTFALNTDGSLVAPSQILSTPTLNLNGVDKGPLEKPWITAIHDSATWSTPGSIMINPGDVVTLTAPTAWANTPAGSVGALSGAIDNRSGGSSVGADTMTKTLRFGLNMPANSTLEIYPFRNAKFQVPFSFDKLPPGIGYQIVSQPCESGTIAVVWDATIPATPAQFAFRSLAPSRVTVTHLPQYDVSPSNGIGYVRVYQVAYVPSSDYKTVAGGSAIGFDYADPVYSGTSNYNNLAFYLNGEFDVTNIPDIVDRSDTYAVSRIHQARVTNNVGSVRGVDMTACGGGCETFPYPELLIRSNVEFFWGYDNTFTPRCNFTSIGPVDVTATPWIYSAQFRQPANQFSATLTDTISTTPASGTHETWHFSDGSTAPLMAGLEVQVDSEVVRILSGSGSTWVVFRGSNGTTPATHSPGTVTVFGRASIGSLVRADGTAPYSAPALLTTATPHGMTTLHGYNPVTSINITLVDGSGNNPIAAHPYGLSQQYPTGPNSFVSIWSGAYPTYPNGLKPDKVYTLDGSTNYILTAHVQGVPLDIYANHVSRFPLANLHVNVPVDACDDMVYRYAQVMRDNFPAGRKIFVEYANEPWNFSYPFKAWLFCRTMGPLAMPPSLIQFHDFRDYYIYRATQVHAIFRSVFAAAGRGGEIVGIVNCQMASGASQATPYLNWALAQGQPLDAIACAPYFSMADHPQTLAAFNQYDDDQAAELLLHDITYNPVDNIVPWLQNMQAAVNSYNAAHGKSCILMCYEGAIEWAAPPGATYHDQRSHDIFYNPNMYHVIQGWLKILQDNGVTAGHYYSEGMGWGPPAWGARHMRTQKDSRGDGLNGANDNRLTCIAPNNPHYIGVLGAPAYIYQDITNDSVVGQALVDWNNAVGTGPPPSATAYTLTSPSPASGQVNIASGNFTVTPNGIYTGTVTITPSGGGLSTPIVLTWSSSSSPQSFTITPTATGTVTLTPTNSGGLTDASPVTYTVTGTGLATAYTFTAPDPATGFINIPSGNFTVTPNGAFTGSITITLAMGGLTGPVILSWSNSSVAQAFNITPTIAATITLTPSNSGNLPDPATLTYVATSLPPPPDANKFILVRKVIANIMAP